MSNDRWHDGPSPLGGPPPLPDALQRKLNGQAQPQMAQPVSVTTQLLPLDEAEVEHVNAAHAETEYSADDFIALRLDCATFMPLGVDQNGAMIWQLQCITPPGFFRTQKSRLLDASGVDAGIRKLMGKAFRSGRLPAVRVLVRRDMLADHVHKALVEREAADVVGP